MKIVVFQKKQKYILIKLNKVKWLSINNLNLIKGYNRNLILVKGR